MNETFRSAALARRHAPVFLLLLLVVLAGAHPAAAALINRRLSGDMVAGGSVLAGQWALSPEGQYAIFIADRLTNDHYELFSVPAGGGVPLAISGALASGHDVAQALLAGSQMAVYGVTPPGSVHMTRLYAARLDGSQPPVLITPNLGTYGYIQSFRVSPDGQYVAYLVDDSLTTAAEDIILYLSDLSGDWRIVSPCDLAEHEACSVAEDYAFTPNSARLVYLGCEGVCVFGPGLSSAAIPDDDPIHLLSGVFSFVLTPDSLFAIAEGQYDLFKLPLDGTASTALVTDFQSNRPYAVNANSTRLVYTAYSDSHEILKSIPLSGGAAVELSGALAPDGNMVDFKISPDGANVVFRADRLTDEKFELFGVAITGGAPVRLSGATMNGDVQDDYQFTPDGLSVVYRADQATAGQVELFVRVWGSGAPVKLSNTLLSAGDVRSFAIFPNGLSVAYCADRENDEKFEVYGWTSAGSGAHFKISTEPMAGDVSEYAITPDSRSVVYRADQQTALKHELWVTRSEYVNYLPLAVSARP